jgi:hypothetical protein
MRVEDDGDARHMAQDGHEKPQPVNLGLAGLEMRLVHPPRRRVVGMLVE